MAAPQRAGAGMPRPPSAGKPGTPAAMSAAALFSENGALGARADVRVVCADGEVLHLHRFLLEMWSALMAQLIEAATESQLDDDGSLPTIHVSDAADDLLLLLENMYPTPKHHGRAHGPSAPSALQLLQLADKYQCPHIIDRCASFIHANVLPRLASSSDLRDTADLLGLSPPATPSSSNRAFVKRTSGGAAEAVVEWVLTCLHVATRLELASLAEGAAELLGRRFFEWELQADTQREMLAQACVPPRLMVDHLLRSIPTAPASGGAATNTAAGAASTATSYRGDARLQPGGAPAGGPRIVPVGVAAAGAAPAAPPLLQAGNGAGALAMLPPQHAQHPHMEHQHEQHAAPVWAGVEHFFGPAIAQHPEPLLGPGGAQ